MKIFKSRKLKLKTDPSLFKTDKNGFNKDHYFKVVKSRRLRGLPLLKDYTKSYEHKNRDGRYRVDGTKIKSSYHPLHDKLLVDSDNNKYHIDVVSEHFYYGKYISLYIREVGTKSHKVIFWENISCHDEITLNFIKENKKRFKLIKND